MLCRHSTRACGGFLLLALLVLTAGTYVNVIRIIPPLVTTPQEVDQALAILHEALDAAGA